MNLEILGFKLRIPEEMHSGELLGRDSEKLLEFAGEMAVLFKAEEKCHFLYRASAIEQMAGIVQTKIVEPSAQF